MSEASEVESLTDRLLGVIARWLTEAKRDRERVAKLGSYGFDTDASLCEITAKTLERCAKEISEALQKAEGE